MRLGWIEWNHPLRMRPRLNVQLTLSVVPLILLFRLTYRLGLENIAG